MPGFQRRRRCVGSCSRKDLYVFGGPTVRPSDVARSRPSTSQMSGSSGSASRSVTLMMKGWLGFAGFAVISAIEVTSKMIDACRPFRSHSRTAPLRHVR